VTDATGKEVSMGIAFAVIHVENGTFGVSWPDFPGLITGGETMEEAARKADEALSFHISGMIEDGDPVPVPRSQTELYKDPDFLEMIAGGVLLLTRFELPKRAVRINISMDESLISAIDRAASTFGESRSHFLAEAAKLRLGNGAR
jgi:predicted RNase H-like HicB family nuclease